MKTKEIPIPPAIRAFAEKLPAAGPWMLEPYDWDGTLILQIRSTTQLDGAHCCPILRLAGLTAPAVDLSRHCGGCAEDLAPLVGLSERDAFTVMSAADALPDEPDDIPLYKAVRELLLEKCGVGFKAVRRLLDAHG